MLAVVCVLASACGGADSEPTCDEATIRNCTVEINGVETTAGQLSAFCRSWDESYRHDEPFETCSDLFATWKACLAGSEDAFGRTCGCDAEHQAVVDCAVEAEQTVGH